MLRWLAGVVVLNLAGLTPSVATAQVRRTVVVNLAADQETGALAAERIRALLEKHQNLRPLQEGLLATSLEGPLPTEGAEVAVLKKAKATLKRARTELAAFRTSRALAGVRDAEAALLGVAPSAESQALLAELAFFAGRVHLREQNRGLARSSFELALRLVPDFPDPNPGRFNPDIVSTFAEARARQGKVGGGTLEVEASYDGRDREIEVFVDGKSIGKTPLAVSVAAGTHYIAAVSPEYRVVTRRTDVGDGDSVALELSLQTVSDQTIALRLRKAAIEKGTVKSRSNLASLARSFQLLGRAECAVIVRGTVGDITLAAYKLESEVGTDFLVTEAGTDRLLALLSPVRSPRPDEKLDLRPKPVPWYRRSEVIAGGTGGALAAIALTIFFVSAADDAAPNRTGIPGTFP